MKNLRVDLILLEKFSQKNPAVKFSRVKFIFMRKCQIVILAIFLIAILCVVKGIEVEYDVYKNIGIVQWENIYDVKNVFFAIAILTLIFNMVMYKIYRIKKGIL